MIPAESPLLKEIEGPAIATILVFYDKYVHSLNHSMSLDYWLLSSSSACSRSWSEALFCGDSFTTHFFLEVLTIAFSKKKMHPIESKSKI